MPDLGLFFDRLIGTTLQGSVLLLLVWFITSKLGPTRPKLRNVLWSIALIHFVGGLVFSMPLRVFPATPPLLINAVEPVKAASLEEATKLAAANHIEIYTQAEPTWPLMLWGGGALLFVTLLLVREWRFQHRIRRASVTDERLQTLVGEVATELGIRRVPQLQVCTILSAPCVTGVFKTKICWPAALLGAYDESEERIILAHELIHVRNGDLLLGWLAAFIRCLFFFNPLVWVANRVLGIQSEWVCDHETLRLTNVSKQTYCKLLIDLAAKPPHPPMTAHAASRDFKTLHQRIDRMTRRSTRNKGATNVAVLGALLVAAAVAVPVSLIEKEYDLNKLMDGNEATYDAVKPVEALDANDVPTIDLNSSDVKSVGVKFETPTGDAVLDSKVYFEGKDAQIVDLLSKVEKQSEVSIDPGPLRGLRMTATFDGAMLHTVLDSLASNTGLKWKRTSKREFRFE